MPTKRVEALMKPLFDLLFMWGSRTDLLMSKQSKLNSPARSVHDDDSSPNSNNKRVEVVWAELDYVAANLLLYVPLLTIIGHIRLTILLLHSEGMDTDTLAQRWSDLQWSHWIGVALAYLYAGKCFLATSVVISPVVGLRFLAYCLTVFELSGLVVSHWLADALDLATLTLLALAGGNVSVTFRFVHSFDEWIKGFKYTFKID